jgi:hypothetical protein
MLKGQNSRFKEVAFWLRLGYAVGDWIWVRMSVRVQIRVGVKG